MIDLDDFKLYNDIYGHDMGDQCISEPLPRRSTTASVKTDKLVRYGGDEFLLILTEYGQRHFAWEITADSGSDSECERFQNVPD